ncbi:MAG: DUF554 domain-containing protein [Limnochordia bacterium]|jgi:uncharacterized membrane protein YqgA involved in biofilm formation|nr:DUF554 domain-containing protein [Bacillota bacterium]HOB08845.1 DUF554 domain-containing protein [Limnochordia bacterium]HPT92405.1 DUF554 domain-containing protein [Limnochordia bacterium]HPZ30435.1 DUF554 domain-containing protein [Limnochordia bacterium]HQD70741.1 DUF554 domain-containing protein [Limnochordia bacterium]
MLWGTIVNACAVVVGAAIGLLLRLREDVRLTIMQGLGLVTIALGVKMGLDHGNILIPIASIVIGGFIGESLKIESRLAAVGKWLGRRRSAGEASRIVQGFVTASLVYCVGAMAVIGALEGGLKGTHDTLYTKAMLDGVTSIFFASSFGIGVLFSAVPVFVYQGAIALFASFLEPLFHPSALQAIGATGGVMIIGVGINILGIGKVPVGNLLPSLAVALIISMFVH